MISFYAKLASRWEKGNSLLCVGLDPDLAKLPNTVRTTEQPMFEFCRQIIDTTAPWVCAFKPQIAYFAAVGAENDLAETIQYIHGEYPDIPVILDAKRGDIDSTATMYAREVFERFGADAVTVNPYMGGDSLTPFTSYKDKGVIVLCRTSNAGSGDLQAFEGDALPVYQQVATLAASKWNGNQNLALVVGATYPKVIGEVRQIVGDMPLLVPGIGVQCGDLEAVLKYGLTADKVGLMINVSRSVIYASCESNFAQAAGSRVQQLCEKINRIREA